MAEVGPLAGVRTTKRARVFFGWWVVLVGFLGDFMALGMGSAALGALQRPMKASLGWNFTQISIATAVQSLLSMAVGPLAGSIQDKYGARPVMVFGALTAGIGLVLMAFIQEIWQFYLLFAIIGALGLHETGRTVNSVAISKWFVRKLRVALAISSLGSPFGGVVMAPVIALLVVSFGWRQSWGILGIVLLVTLLPPVILFMRRSPEDMGLQPDGDGPVPAAGQAPALTGPLPKAEVSLTLKQALRTRAFWILTFTTNLSSVLEISLIFHLLNYLQDDGLSLPQASFVFSLNFVGSMMSRGVWLFALGRWSVHYCLAANVTVRAAGFLALIALPHWAGIPLFLLGHGIFGGGFGYVVSYAWPVYFGRKFQGAIRGWNRFFSISALVGPVFAAYIRDATGSYNAAFLLMIILSILAGLVALWGRPPMLQKPVSLP